MSKIFINRPIVAMVISIVMVIIGAITILTLPVALFPNTQQIMSLFDPAFNWMEWRDVARPLLPWTWRPNTVGLVLAGVVLFLGIIFIQRGQTVFLYFNF